jgi:hypothetical protein
MIPAGIEPATFRFVAQHLSHCVTAVREFMYFVKITYKLGICDPLDMTLCPWGSVFLDVPTRFLKSSAVMISNSAVYKQVLCLSWWWATKQTTRQTWLALLVELARLHYCVSRRWHCVWVSVMQCCIFPQDITHMLIFVTIFIPPHFLSTYQSYFEHYKSSSITFKSLYLLNFTIQPYH